MASGLSVVGGAVLRGAFNLSFGGQRVDVELVGAEVGRVFTPVPEPSTGVLAGAGLIVLAGARPLVCSRRWRRDDGAGRRVRGPLRGG